MNEDVKICPNCGRLSYRKNMIGDWYCKNCKYSGTRRSLENVDQD